MAALAYAEQMLLDQLEPVTGFLESGMEQVTRVLKGPKPRQQVPATHGYKRQSRKRGLTALAKRDSYAKRMDTTERSARSPTEQQAGASLLRPSPSPVKKHSSAFVLASLPASPLSYTSTGPTSRQLQVLSDTVRHIFAGTAARTMSQVFIHPIDTVKTRLQVNKLTAPLELQNWRRHSKVQRVNISFGQRQVLSLRNWLVQGPVDLYRGLTGAILGTIPVALVYFGTYEACKSALESRGAPGATAHLASASAGAVLSAFIRVPTDTLKHRAQAYIVPDIFQGARSILAQEGIQGLYHGLLPTLLRDVPELALQFSLYESLRQTLERHRKVKKLRTWEHLVLGGFSGGVAASVTMPLDVVKTALQCGNSGSITATLGAVVREKGVQGLFAGMGPRVTQIALQGAMFFTLFEAWKAQLKPSPLRIEDDRLMAPKLWRKRRGHVWKRQFVFQ